VKADGGLGEAGGADGVQYRIDGSGGVSEWCRDLGISNTLLWSPDNSRFYFGDSSQNQIWSYNYDQIDGCICNEQPFFQGLDCGLPDGSTIDSDGYIWNCRYGGSCIVRVAPDGSVDRVIEMPVSNLTNCTFGGKQGTTLTSPLLRLTPGDGSDSRVACSRLRPTSSAYLPVNFVTHKPRPSSEAKDAGSLDAADEKGFHSGMKCRSQEWFYGRDEPAFAAT
jgi:SMP-30/Gluconolactonase/LRE-like region